MLKPALEMDAIRHELKTNVIGRELRWYAQVGSTNDLAREAARAGEAEGLALVAEEQTAGRGRMGRGWVAPPGHNLLLSLLLRPAWLPPEDAFRLTMLAGVALAEAVERTAGIVAALKWPNDLMLPVATPGGPSLCKAAGILSEVEVDDGRIDWAVIGMGINVNWSPEAVIDGRDLRLLATSIAASAGRPIAREPLLLALLKRLDERYSAWRRDGPDELFSAWRDRLATIGREVTVRLPGGEIRGFAEDVEPSGALRLRDARGERHRILTGDVMA